MWQSRLTGVFVAILGSVLCQDKFQCVFDTENFDIKGATGDNYVWGPEGVSPYIVDTQEDLETLIDKIDEVRAMIFKENIYDDLEPFLRGYKELSGAKNQEAFINEYDPPVASQSNQAGMILKTFLQFVEDEDLSDLENHSYLALATKMYNREEMDKFVEENPQGPTQSVGYDFLVGVIKISLDSRVGYIVINMQHPMFPSPYILETRFKPSSLEELNKVARDILEGYKQNQVENPEAPPPELGRVETYSLLGNNNYVTIEGYEFNKPNSSYELGESDLIYVGRPLCSFKLVQNRIDFKQNIYRSMLKYDTEFNLRAFVNAWLVKIESTPCMTVGYRTCEKYATGYLNQDTWEKHETTFDKPEDLNLEDKQTYLIKAAEEMGYSPQVLKERLSNFFTVAAQVAEKNKDKI